MLQYNELLPSFAVDDLEQARRFYQGKLGLEVRDGNMPGILEIHGSGQAPVLVYPKPDYQPATFTVLNFAVPDVERAVDRLTADGIRMEQYDRKDLKTDQNGIVGKRGEPQAAWFKDPAGNILSLVSVPNA